MISTRTNRCPLIVEVELRDDNEAAYSAWIPHSPFAEAAVVGSLGALGRAPQPLHLVVVLEAEPGRRSLVLRWVQSARDRASMLVVSYSVRLLEARH